MDSKNFFFSSYKEILVEQRVLSRCFARKGAKLKCKSRKGNFAALLSYFALRETKPAKHSPSPSSNKP
jgi:hypothetical protein